MGTEVQRNYFYPEDKYSRCHCNISACLPHCTLSLPGTSTVIRIIGDKDCWTICHGCTVHCCANETYFIQGFLDADNAMLQEESLKEEMEGTTAVAIILKDNKLYCVCTCVIMYVITSHLWTGL
jgi:hypothetical protein